MEFSRMSNILRSCKELSKAAIRNVIAIVHQG